MGHKKTDAIDVGTDNSLQNEITMYGIKFDEDPTIAVDTEEIIITDIITSHSEAFTNVALPAPASDKYHEVSITVKVDTGAGGNILLLDSSVRCTQTKWTQVACLRDSLQCKPNL